VKSEKSIAWRVERRAWSQGAIATKFREAEGERTDVRCER